MSNVFRPDLVPYITRKLIEKEHEFLPALLRILGFRIVLVAAHNEPIREIREQFESLRFDLAVRERVIHSGDLRISLDFHVQVRVGQKQTAAKIGNHAQIEMGNGSHARILCAARCPALLPAGQPAPLAASDSCTTILSGGYDETFQFH